MSYAAGIDVGSTYTKALILDEERRVAGRSARPTGFLLAQVAEESLQEAATHAGIRPEDVRYVVATGFGRHQAALADMVVTDLTAAARGATALFPGTRTILDVGGQTMKAIRLGDRAKVLSFRLNDKCAAGTGAFLEKTARYMGYTTEEIGPLVMTSKEAASISGVCAVFAESEVVNHLSQGTAPADIMHGAIVSLVGRSVQLLKRVKAEPEFTLIGGILRFTKMVEVVRRALRSEVNVPEGDLVQFVCAHGAAILAHQGLRRREAAVSGASPGADGRSRHP